MACHGGTSESKVKGCEKRHAKKLVIRHEMFKCREPVCYAVAHVHRIQRCLQTWAEGAHSRRVQIARTARFKPDHAPFRFLGLDRVPSLGKDLGVASRFPGGIKSFLVLVVGLSADVLMSQNFCTGSIYLFLYSYVLGVLSLYILNITSPSIVWLIVVYYGIPEPLAYLSFLPVR